MTEDWAARFTDPALVIAILVALAVFATFYTIAMPYFERGDLNKRMRAVSTERDLIRARERAKLNAEAAQSRASLRTTNNKSVRDIVERFNLRKALVDDTTVDKLKAAGLRSQNALNMFLVARFLLPFATLALTAFWIFVMGNLAEKPLPMRLFATIVGGYIGFYLPNIYISNRITKRQQSIRREIGRAHV